MELYNLRPPTEEEQFMTQPVTPWYLEAVIYGIDFEKFAVRLKLRPYQHGRLSSEGER